MLRRTLLLAVGGLLSLAFGGAFPLSAQETVKPPHAEPQPVRAVMELFTSQGCSSCPPADALFVRLARDPTLLVLTLPVDYWDYLGWRDTLAQPAFSQRQRGYAKARGDLQVYTPQAVIDGAAHAVASDWSALQRILVQHEATPMPLGVRISEANNRVSIAISGEGGAGSVWLVHVARSRQVTIPRGENKGREISYANVVRGLMRVGSWRGVDMTVELPLSLTRHEDADTYAVLVHDDSGRIGRVIGAAKAPGF
jgi:hypothetical protein